MAAKWEMEATWKQIMKLSIQVYSKREANLRCGAIRNVLRHRWGIGSTMWTRCGPFSRVHGMRGGSVDAGDRHGTIDQCICV